MTTVDDCTLTAGRTERRLARGEEHGEHVVDDRVEQMSGQTLVLQHSEERAGRALRVGPTDDVGGDGRDELGELALGGIARRRAFERGAGRRRRLALAVGEQAVA